MEVAVVTPTTLIQRRNVKLGAMAEMIIKAQAHELLPRIPYKM
jgi:hypothetical protein